MELFGAVKDAVTTRQAAEFYGIDVKSNGMARCIFHNDHSPSMKLDKRYHCFGCHADGDVINFVAGLFGMGNKEAAEKISKQLIKLGVKCFWNFSHFDLTVNNPDVMVENVHLGDSLTRLSYKMNNN